MEIVRAPTSLVMGVLERIRLSVPKMMKIWWQNSTMVPSDRRATYAHLLKIEERAKALIADGSMSLDGRYDGKAVGKQ